MRTTTFELESTTTAPRPRVHALMSDLRNYVDVHPLLLRVVELPRDPCAPYTQRCRVYERVHIGPIPVRSSYLATIHARSEHELLGEAWSFPRVHLRTIYTLLDESPGTRIRERVVIEAPGPLISFVRRTARSAHAELLERIARHLES